MNDLGLSLKNMTRRSAEGSFATRADRERGLHAMTKDLKALGYRHLEAHSLKPKHVTALVAHWKKEGRADGTIRNRLAWLRFWAEKTQKNGMLPHRNGSYGLARRTRYQGNRARELDAATLDRVRDERIRLALRLEEAFGLRREEALKFRPAASDRGRYIALVPSTTKGGRYREIRLTDPGQRALLEELRAVVGTGSLIPEGMQYVDFLQRYKHQTRTAGLGNGHALRHAYAQRRYAKLTGWLSPAAGGPTRDGMTADQARRDRAVRLKISRELGHNRLDITDTYLGRATAPAAIGKPAA